MQKELTEEEAEKEEKKERILMNLTVAFSVVLAIGIFMVLPYFLSNLVRSYVASHWVLTIVEGVIRVGIFPGVYCAHIQNERYPADIYVSWSGT